MVQHFVEPSIGTDFVNGLLRPGSRSDRWTDKESLRIVFHLSCQSSVQELVRFAFLGHRHPDCRRGMSPWSALWLTLTCGG